MELSNILEEAKRATEGQGQGKLTSKRMAVISGYVHKSAISRLMADDNPALRAIAIFEAVGILARAGLLPELERKMRDTLKKRGVDLG